MTTEELLEDFIGRSQRRSQVKTIGVGRAINVSTTKCDVKRDGRPTLFNVRLNAVISSLDSYVTIVPQEGAYVLFGILENRKEEAVILNVSEVDKILVKVGETIYEVTSSGTKVEGGGENLKNVLNDMIAELEKIVVVVGTTINVAAMEQIKLRLNKILV